MSRIQYFIQNPLQLLYMLPALMLGLTLHEWGHAYAAFRCGDPTARNLGRMSLNPLDHFDILGTLCLLFLGFGWAKPVPVNPRNFKHFRRDDIIVSLAGVTMNLVQVVVFSALFILLVRRNNALFFNDAFYSIFLNLIGINTTLIIFNLLPIPPLDGSHVAESLLARHVPYKVFAFLRQYGRYILLALLWLGILDYPIAWAQNLVFGLISKLLVA
ncbi:MAG: site-2 protease family protein [Clostridia bacterium]|nr:site-2 protease family protein [Clostridia bacterium]